MNPTVTLNLNVLRLQIFLVLLVCILTGTTSAQSPDALPLAESGPYAVSTRDLQFSDESRNERPIHLTIWYPAVEKSEAAEPDLSDAPYPVIIYIHGYGGVRTDIGEVVSHLVSYGFVVAAANHIDFTDRVFIDRPLDILFEINRLDEINAGDLYGLWIWSI